MTRLVRRGSYPYFTSQTQSLLEKVFTNFDDFSRYTISGDQFPKLNVYAEDDAFYIEATVAGIPKEDIKVDIEDGLLTINYTPVEKAESEDRKTYHREIKRTSFSRSVTLRDDIDVEKIEGDINDGILTIYLPLKESAKPKKKTLTF